MFQQKLAAFFRTFAAAFKQKGFDDKFNLPPELTLPGEEMHTDMGFRFHTMDGRPVVEEYKASSSSLDNVIIAHFTYSNGCNVVVKTGMIQCEEVDAILNITRRHLQLDCGGVSGAVLAAAGQAIQRECNQGHPQPLDPGEIFATSGGRLPVKTIFHGWCDAWDGGKSLRKLMSGVLLEAHNHHYKSFALPAVGTGQLQYPPEDVAKIIVHEIDVFLKAHQDCTLVDIRIVLFPDNYTTIDAFSTIITTLCQQFCSMAKKTEKETS